MKLLAALTTLSLVVPAALAASPLACSSTSVTPCVCPNGNTYDVSVTFAIIDAKAIDVKNVIADYLFSPKALTECF